MRRIRFFDFQKLLLITLCVSACGKTEVKSDVFPNPLWQPAKSDISVPSGSVGMPLPIGGEDDSAAISLVIHPKALVFRPSPLYSVFIYKGVWDSYDKALVESSPVAYLSANQSCTKSRGQCWESPVAKDQCVGCDTLDKNETYTGFLLQYSSQMLDEILIVPVRFQN